MADGKLCAHAALVGEVDLGDAEVGDEEGHEGAALREDGDADLEVVVQDSQSGEEIRV